MSNMTRCIFNAVKDFASWLNVKMQGKGWTSSELARRAKVATSTMSTVLSGKSRPGWDFCAGVAQALEESPCTVFRLAGLLPPLPEVDTEEPIELLKTLPAVDRKEVVAYVRFRYQRSKEKG
jgi:transcriptional regulator with XRE-family HTH domain